MPVTVSHALSATTPDDPSYEIRPSHWNSAHNVTLSATAGTEIFGAFSNDPAVNVSFSTNAGGQVIASANVTAAPSPVNVTGANGSSVNAQTIAFSNSNGVTLGVSTAANGATVTASYTVPGATVFSNSNNVSFGLNGSTVTATATAAQSNQNITAANGGFAFQTLSFSNLNGMSFGTSAGSAITASYTVPTVTNSSWTVSDNATSATVGRLAFTQSNGLTLSLSTSNNGNHTVIGSYTVPTVTNSSWTVSDAATSATVGRLAFTNSNGLTMALITSNNGNHTVTGSYTVPSVTEFFSKTNTTFNGANVSGSLTLNTNGLQVSLSVAPGGGAGFTGGVSTGGNTAGNTGTQTGQIIFVGSNNVTMSVGTAAAGAQTITVSGPTLTDYFSKTNTTFNGANISGSITHNTNGLQLSLSVAAPGAAAENNAINLLGNNTAGNTTATGSTIGWSGLNLTLSGTNNSQVVVSAPATSSLVGSSGISLSSNGSTITIGQVVGSYFDNVNGEWQNSTTMQALQSTSHVQPFLLENPLSFGYIRIPMSLSIAPSTTAATTGNTQWSYGHTRSHNFVIYSRGIGASSLSLQYVASTQLTDQQSMNISANANSTQFSYTNRATFQMSTGAVGYTFDYSSSAASLNFHSSQMTGITGLKMMEFKWATSLAPGNYWLMYGISSSTTSQFTNAGTKWFDIASQYGLSQPNLAFGTIGDATNSSVGPFFGLGSFTTGGAAGTTNSLPISAISTSGSHNKMFFAMANIA